jgi:hypothetical protein
VATAGDINSDGYSDVLIGAPDAARAYVHMGSSSGLAAAAAVSLYEAPVGDLFGASVATAGDVNGDGYSDVIIAHRCIPNPEANEGVAFVYHGAKTGLVTPWASGSK